MKTTNVWRVVGYNTIFSFLDPIAQCMELNDYTACFMMRAEIARAWVCRSRINWDLFNPLIHGMREDAVKQNLLYQSQCVDGAGI